MLSFRVLCFLWLRNDGLVGWLTVSGWAVRSAFFRSIGTAGADEIVYQTKQGFEIRAVDNELTITTIAYQAYLGQFLQMESHGISGDALGGAQFSRWQALRADLNQGADNP